MTGVRGVVRILAGAALTVFVGVAVNQILSEGKFSWTWLYISLGIAVLLLLYSEAFAAPVAGTVPSTARGGRRGYLRQLRASVRDMETVGVATPGQFVLRMRQVYVDVSLAPQTLHTAAGEPYLGAVSGSEAATRPGERRSLESVLRDADRDRVARVLAVVGGPGSGKTTLTRNTALFLCRHRWGLRKPMLPVLLYLRDHAAALLADETPGLGQVAVSAGWLEGKVSAPWMERQLDRGGCVVLLDGLDEVAGAADRTRVVSWITRQIQRHPHNVYVVTSRPHGYESNPLPGAEVLQVRRFTAEQISQFLHQWSYATERRAREGTDHEVRAVARRNAEDLLARLRDQPALYDLAANPLLLTMTANVHRYRGQLPGTRAELYAEMCDVLLHRRSEARGLHDGTGLSGPHKQHIVQHLALAMMEARTRDWPVSDAVEAIRYPLQQVPGDVAPEVFLDEARKSGLLVEREHGIYGFAHLTLQEYLAAAQLSTPHADTSLLTANVNDPWWRETILLWATANDATAVITTCLDLDAVTPLALAFDCADHARIVDPATRSRLDTLLEPGSPGDNQDPVRRRLLAGVQATRILSETIPLSDTAALCARPIPRTLYDLFIHEELADGRHYSYGEGLTGSDGDSSAPAIGMHAQDAERFIHWLNTITSDTVYRLPTPVEVSDPAAAMAADLTLHTVWAHDGAHTVLHQPPGVTWPYASSYTQLRTLPVADRQQISACLWFLTNPPARRAEVEARARVIAAALKHAPECRSDSELAPLELVLNLAVAFTFVRVQVRVRETGLQAGLGLGSTLRRVAGITRGRFLDSTRESDRLFGLARALNQNQVFDLDGRNEDQLGATVRLAVHLAREVMLRDHDVDLDPAVREVSPAEVRTLAHAFARVLDARRSLDLAHDLDFDLDEVFHLGVALDVSVAAHLADRSRGRAFVDALDRERRRDLFLGEPDLDQAAVAPHLADDFNLLSLDRALDLAVGTQNRAQKAGLAALTLLLNIWMPTAGTRDPQLDSFDNFLSRPDITSLSSSQRVPEDPTIALRRAQSVLRTGQTDTSRPALAQARLLVELALELVTALRDRGLLSDAYVLAYTRTALLAAAAALRQPGQQSEAAELLLLAWRHLASDVAANQVLLVVRTRQ